MAKSGRNKTASVATKAAKKKSSRAIVKPVRHNEGSSASPAIPSSKVALWKFDRITRKLIWSANAHLLFGFGKPSLLPRSLKPFLTIIHEDDRGRVEAALTSGASAEQGFIIEARLGDSPGAERWIELSFEAPRRKISKVVSKVFSGLVQDITTKKLTEFELLNWKQRNELVSESAGLLIYDYDVATGDIIWTGSSLPLVGFTSAEMGRIEVWEQLIHPDDRDEANRLLDLARRELKTYDVYYRFRKKDNSYCFMHDRGQFVSDGAGNAVRMLGVMNDVSERVAAERTIQQSEKSFRELFNSVGEGIWIQRPDGTIVDVNQGACDMYGYTKEELIGKNPGFVAAPDKNNFDVLRAKMREALAGKPQTFLWYGRRKNGETFVLDVKLTRGTYFGDNIIISTSWDITDKIEAEASLLESERRFRRLVEDLNVGVIVQDSEGKVQIVNGAALCLVGADEARVTQRTLADKDWNLVTEDGHPLSVDDQPWNIAARTGVAARGIVIGLQRAVDGKVAWALVNAEPVRMDGKLLNVVITLTDITDRRLAEEALKESELRFRTLQEASFGGIGLHNKGVIIDCNQGLCDLTGYSYEELRGSNGLFLIAPEFRDFVYQQIVDRVEQPYDVEGVRKDGTRYSLEIHGKNIPYKEGLIRVTEFRDITDRKAAEAKILEQNARLIAITDDLKVKNEQLQEFTQIVSHNLRSPVGNILSLLNFIENAETPEERLEYITLLREAGASTLTTLHELNDVLQIKQNKNIEKQDLEFEQVFGNVRRMLVAKIVETNATIDTDFSEAPRIRYPNIYLESIMLNLISNALKYHHPERDPKILVRTLMRESSVCLEVRDNGQGINMERYGHHIFKLRKTFHKHPESRGIGLFMIKNQIDAMGGEIFVTSTENEGTAFVVNFNTNLRDDG